MFFGKRRKKKGDERPPSDDLDDDFGFEESRVEESKRSRPPARKPVEPDDSFLSGPMSDSDSDSSHGRGLEDHTFVEAPKPSARASKPLAPQMPKSERAANVDDPDAELPDATMFIGRAVDSTVLLIGWLVVTAGPNRGRDFRLTDGVTRVGKSTECQIRLLTDDYVSTVHATLGLENGAYVLRDLGSTNGTLHNGTRVASAIRLNDGDQIRFGLSDFVFKSCRLA